MTELQLVEPMDDDDLTRQERLTLTRAEKAIEDGVRSQRAAWEALRSIRDGRLYRATHSTFEAYCRDRWNLNRATVYRQIEALAVVEVLSSVDDIPVNQSRELVPLLDDPDRLREVYATAVTETDGKPTAAAIKAVREAHPEQKVPTTTTPHPDHRWAKRVERISATIPADEFTDDELRRALGAAQFLYELLRGQTILRGGKP